MHIEVAWFRLTAGSVEAALLVGVGMGQACFAGQQRIAGAAGPQFSHNLGGRNTKYLSPKSAADCDYSIFEGSNYRQPEGSVFFTNHNLQIGCLRLEIPLIDQRTRRIVLSLSVALN